MVAVTTAGLSAAIDLRYRSKLVDVEAWLSAVENNGWLYVRASTETYEEDDIYEPVARWIEEHRATLVERFESDDPSMWMGTVIVSVYKGEA